MILFENIRWKNFLSTGNQFSEINLNTNDQTTLIIGSNGSGKSTVLDALTFSLFNKPYRKISKSQLVNTVNEKDCRVELEFSIGTTSWKIIRGIKPNIFEIWRDDKLLDQSSSANDQQKWLEQNVVKMNYKSFTQIVILGSSTFIPFMQLTAPNRRDVIEDLLDIRIFTAMNNIIKDKIRVVKEDVRTLDLKKESLNDKVDMQQKFIDEIESRGKQRITDKEGKIKILNIEVDTHMEENEHIQVAVDEFTKEQQEVSGSGEKLVELNNFRGKISQKVASITKEHKFFTQNTVCPTCTQSIDEDFRINKIDDAQTKAQELQTGYQELEKAIKEEQERERHFTHLSKEITKLTHGISKNNTRISGCQDKSEIWNRKFKQLPNNLKIEVLSMTS
tara:strand:+ start:1576 stop:2748 length:1173 start_codon:yes stop_codon:yes gene_type:complete